jgi:riboflavin synthase
MFTGIIETIGTVRNVRQGPGVKVVSVDIGKAGEGVEVGDSIAINGVCLTVSQISGSVGEFDVSKETLERSTIEKLRSGSSVNIERAMSVNGRFGGHIVQGHVDGTAVISSIDNRGDFAEIKFAAEAGLVDEIVTKGSVAVDGISLTAARTDKESFTVSVIPTTMKDTTLGSAKIGDEVNIETDIIIKAVKKQLAKMLPAKGGLTAERLKELGF